MLFRRSTDVGSATAGIKPALDLVLVSIDDHLIEPADMFEGRMPSRFRESAPRVVRAKFEGDTTDFWAFDELLIPLEGLDSLAARRDCAFRTRPRGYRDLDPALSSPGARLLAMDRAGIWGSLSYPSFPGFGARLFAAPTDPRLAAAVVRAYNDWQVEAWAGLGGGRLHAISVPMLWDPEAAADEVQRVAGFGVRAMCFPENPAAIGLPSLHTRHWDRVWAACQEACVTVMIHMGSAIPPMTTSPDSPVEVMLTVQPFAAAACVADLVWSGVLERFAELRFVMAESGIGWVPALLERLDTSYWDFQAWSGRQMSVGPSDLVRRGVRFGFMADRVGMTLLHQEVAELAVWAADFPHSDGCWRDPTAVLSDLLGGLPADASAAVTHGTALRLLGADVPEALDRHACTVSKLQSRSSLVSHVPG